MATLLSSRTGGSGPLLPFPGVDLESQANSLLARRFREPDGRSGGTGFLTLADAQDPSRSTGFVRGVSLSGVLQMLGLERKTCLLEVNAEGRTGIMSLVNGVLVDAEYEEQLGEAAAIEMLSWRHAQTTIMEGISLFRHTVEISLEKLLLESVRRIDESETDNRDSRPSPPSWWPQDRLESERDASDWVWLSETLIISGATVAVVVHAADEQILAAADEHGVLASSKISAAERELASIARGVHGWSRSSVPPVEEYVLRIAGRQVLISALDAGQTVFAAALIEGAEPLDLARGAIRTLKRL